MGGFGRVGGAQIRMTDDQIRLILARCPELTETDLVAALGSSASAEKASAEAFLPDDMVPVAVVGEILDVVISLEERMTALEAAVAHVGEDPVAICRRALADMAVEEKAAVVTELD